MDINMTDKEKMQVVGSFFKENIVPIIGGIVFVAVIAGAYWGYQGYQADKAEKASALFSQMTTAFDQKNATAARKSAEELLAKYGSTGYGRFAEFYLVRMDLEAGKIDPAEKRLKALAQNGKQPVGYKQMTALMLARIHLGQGKAAQTLDDLKSPESGAFAAQYEELRGDAYLALKRTEEAKKAYKNALSKIDKDDRYVSILRLKLHDLGEAV